MLTMTIEDLGAERKLGDAYRFVNDFAIPLKIYADVIATHVEHRFATGDDGKWEDIKPETRKRRKGDKTAPPGTDLGEMRAAATATRPGVPHSLFEMATDGLTMGVDTDGAAAFQNGTNDGSQPPRPFLELLPEDLEEAANRYGALLSAVVGGS